MLLLVLKVVSMSSFPTFFKLCNKQPLWLSLKLPQVQLLQSLHTQLAHLPTLLQLWLLHNLQTAQSASALPLAQLHSQTWLIYNQLNL
jgi:hypothetical protein